MKVGSVPPYLDCFVFPTACHPLPVWCPVDRKDLIRMSREIIHQLCRLDIPNLDRRVLAGTDQQARIPAKADLVHSRDMAAKVGHERAVARPPQLHMAVPAGRSDPAAIRRKGNVRDLLLMTCHARNGLAAATTISTTTTPTCRLPQRHRIIVRRRHQPLHNLPTLARYLPIPLPRHRHPLPLRQPRHIRIPRRPRLVKPRPQCPIRRQRQMIHPVRMCTQHAHRLEIRAASITTTTTNLPPHPHRPVLRRGIHAPIPTPLHTRHARGVAAQHRIRPLPEHIPDPHRRILRRRRHARPARRLDVQRLPRDAGDPLGVAAQRSADRFARARLPQPHGVIHAAGRQQLRVRRPREREHPAGMPAQHVHRRPRLAVPDADARVAAPARQTRRRIRRKLHRQHRLLVARQRGRAPRDGSYLVDGLRLDRQRLLVFERVVVRGAEADVEPVGADDLRAGAVREAVGDIFGGVGGGVGVVGVGSGRGGFQAVDEQVEVFGRGLRERDEDGGAQRCVGFVVEEAQAHAAAGCAGGCGGGILLL